MTVICNWKKKNTKNFQLQMEQKLQKKKNNKSIYMSLFIYFFLVLWFFFFFFFFIVVDFVIHSIWVL